MLMNYNETYSKSTVRIREEEEEARMDKIRKRQKH